MHNLVRVFGGLGPYNYKELDTIRIFRWTNHNKGLRNLDISFVRVLVWI